MRKGVRLLSLVLYSLTLLAADDDVNEIYSCSFVAHTPIGTVSGDCTTQSLHTPGFISRWQLTLIFDEQNSPLAAKIKPDQFYDMVRGQCFEDGAFSTVIPLWGDRHQANRSGLCSRQQVLCTDLSNCAQHCHGVTNKYRAPYISVSV
jgi:hypothetical protein